MELAGLFDVLGMFIGLLLTLFVFSYILGDNALFRIAIHIFVGVAAGYTAFAVGASVLWPQLVLPLLSFDPLQMTQVAVPLVLSVLVFLKAFPRLSGLGKPVVAGLVGVAAAAAVGGAVLGTIIPQAFATMNLLDAGAIQESGTDLLWGLLNGVIILAGTVTTLAYFHFGVRSKTGGGPQRAVVIDWIAWVGQFFIAITFGTLFAGVYAAALVALVERWQFVYDVIRSLFQ